MDPTHLAAPELGFPKAKYASVERERRWLCRELPTLLTIRVDDIRDLYVHGTQLRLRHAQDRAGGDAQRRLTKKADLTPDRRLLTSIYLSGAEYELLQRLPGDELHKVRHYIAGDGPVLTVDVFGGALAGLFLSEAEFRSDAEMHAYPPPAFAVSEVTEDSRYSGGWLSRHGLPAA